MSATEVARKLNITPSAARKLATRGQSVAPIGAVEGLLMKYLNFKDVPQIPAQPGNDG